MCGCVDNIVGVQSGVMKEENCRRDAHEKLQRIRKSNTAKRCVMKKV